MRLGDVLLMRGLVGDAELELAVERQRQTGGRLGENLISLGLIEPEQLHAVMDGTPALPCSIAETGVSPGLLLGLALKFMRVASCETQRDLSRRMHLTRSVVQEIIDDLVSQNLVHGLGSTNAGLVRTVRYALTEQGRAAAGEAMELTQYMGPAPVSLDAFVAQVNKQPITGEILDAATLRGALSGLVLSDRMIDRLVPAVSAGRTVLLYGPPGNGKTSIGMRIAALFTDPVFIPFAIEVSGQIIKMHDPSLHRPYMAERSDGPPVNTGVQIEAFDSRWAACRRPVAVAGGELTLDMLDLRWDPMTRCYDAPLHMKALNGVFLIDDFGRQRVHPAELLNRWIVPLENRVDYLKLNTGMTFKLPFDELVIFSTNLAPADLMDPAFLRRIPYKIEMLGPSLDEYRRIFERAAEASALTLTGAAFDHVVERLTGQRRFELAAFQPHFICEQSAQVCRCFGLPLILTPELAEAALNNLYVGISD